ncbi:MAG: restriction endonuclease subunit S [Halobacteriota archaeon]
MKIETLVPYHLPHEEILLSIASSVIFKELELLDCPKVRLSEVIEQPQYGYTASASHEPVGVKFVRITDIQAGKIEWDSVPYCECEYPDKYLLRENDILFARTGGTTGKSFIVKGDIPDSIFASYLIRIRPKKGAISDFLYWFFKTKQYWSQIVAEKKGSAQPNVNGKKLSSLDISVPESSIQEAIANYLNSYKSKVYGDLLELPSLPAILKDAEKKVAKIESVMAKIEEARRLRAEAVIEVEKTIKSILRKMFLNDGWITDKLGGICDTTSGGTPSRERPDFFNGEIPWLKSGELKDTLIVDSEERITEEALQNSNAKIFTKGTLLIALYGATTGKTGILDIDAATNQAICAIFPNKNIIERDYLHWFLRFKRDDYLFKSFGGAQPNISQKLLKETEISIPPLHEQRRIVAYLDSLQVKVDELKKLQAETEKEIEELVPSILDKAFKGEL